MFALVTPSAKRLDQILEEAELSGYSYREVGTTREQLPEGYNHDRSDDEIGQGRDAFERCCEVLDSFGLQTASGFEVHPKGSTVDVGVSALIVAFIFPLYMTAPVRVVYRVDEPDRHGFAYGTLPGHPERGEEYFGVTIDETETVRADIRAFSKPDALLARAAGPFTRFQQKAALRKYVDILRSAASGRTTA